MSVTISQYYFYKLSIATLLTTFIVATTVPEIVQAISISSTSDQWGVTAMKFVKYRYLWSITHFSHYKPGQYIDSPIFSSSLNKSYEWSIRIFPKRKNDDESITANFTYKNGPVSAVEGHYKVAILNSSFHEVVVFNGTKNFEIGGASVWGTALKRKQLLDPKIVKNDTFTIYAEVLIPTANITYSGNCDFGLSEQYSDHFEKFLNKSELSDVIVSVRNQTFYAHKLILASRNTSILENIVEKEMKLPVLYVKNYTANVVEEFLRYLYTGRTQNFDIMAKELLSIAHRYDVQDLKNLAQKHLCETLNLENAINVLLSADSSNADELKTRAIQFIVAHSDSFIHTEAYKELKKSHPEIVTEICSLMIEMTTLKI